MRRASTVGVGSISSPAIITDGKEWVSQEAKQSSPPKSAACIKRYRHHWHGSRLGRKRRLLVLRHAGGQSPATGHPKVKHCAAAWRNSRSSWLPVQSTGLASIATVTLSCGPNNILAALIFKAFDEVLSWKLILLARFMPGFSDPGTFNESTNKFSSPFVSAQKLPAPGLFHLAPPDVFSH
eukprot:s1821_g10.t1